MGTETHGVDRQIHRAVAGHDYDAHAQLLFVEVTQYLHAGHIRQLQIEQQNIRWLPADNSYNFV